MTQAYDGWALLASAGGISGCARIRPAVVQQLPCRVGRFGQDYGSGYRSPHDPFRLQKAQCARYVLGDKRSPGRRPPRYWNATDPITASEPP